MNEADKLKDIRMYVAGIFSSDVSGHDFYHMQRVADTAEKIAEKENADLFISKAAAWVHDIGDGKLFDDPDQAIREAKDFLASIGCTTEQVALIFQAVKDVSFSKGNIPETLEGKIVQDADRLDAIGAVGIARTFAYGGAKGQLIWDENDPNGTSVQHFYDKLLKLSELMNTRTAKEIAKERHDFMRSYLRQFFSEWHAD